MFEFMVKHSINTLKRYQFDKKHASNVLNSNLLKHANNVLNGNMLETC